MALPLIERAIALLAPAAAKLATKRIAREEAVQTALVKLGLTVKPGPDDFDAIYVRSLVQYGVGKPKPILNLWRDDLVRSSFLRSFKTGDASILQNEIASVLQLNDETHFLGDIDYDLRREIEQFATVFQAAVSEIRTAVEVRFDHALGELLRISDETASGLREILTTLRELRDQPGHRSRPSFSYVQIPPPSLVPPYYVARSDILGRLCHDLEIPPSADPAKDSSRLVALVGIGGTGKSVLGAALCQEQHLALRYPGGTVWLDCQTQASPHQDILLELLGALRIPPPLSPTAEMLSRSIRLALAESPRLVILDDVTDPEEIRVLVQSLARPSSLLLTTREPEIPVRLGITNVINVSGFHPDEARELVEKRTSVPIPDDDWMLRVKPLLARLGFHPLSVALAAAQVSFGITAWDTLASAVADGQLSSAVDFREPHNKAESLRLAFSHTFDSLESPTQRALIWLSTLAIGDFFSLPDAAMVLNGVPEIASQAECVETPHGREFSQGWIEKQKAYAQEVLDHLVRRGILERSQEGKDSVIYRFHPVIHTLALERLKSTKDYQIAVTHHAWVYLSLMATQKGVPAPQHVYPMTHGQVLEVLDRAWATLRDLGGVTLPSKKAAEEAILTIPAALSDQWDLQGELDQKAKWATRALQIAEERTDLESQREFHRSLAEVNLARGELTRCGYHYRMAIKISRALNNETYHHIDLASLATSEQASGDYTSAIRRLKKCETFFKKRGDDHSLGIVLGTLGTAHAGLGEFDRAIRYLQDALEIASRRQDPLAYGSRVLNLAVALRLRARADMTRTLEYLHQSRYMAWRTGNTLSEANCLMNLADAYTATLRFHLAKLCAEEAQRLYSRVGSPRAKAAESAIASLAGAGEDDPEWLRTPDIYQLVEAACRGDKIAEYRVERYSDMLIQHRSEIPDVARLMDAIRQVLQGERDHDKILAGIPDPDGINLRVLLMNLREPLAGHFLTDCAATLGGYLNKEPGAVERLRELLSNLAAPDRTPALLRGVGESLRRALDGETDVSVLVEPIEDKSVQATFRVMLSLGQLVPESSDARISITGKPRIDRLSRTSGGCLK